MEETTKVARVLLPGDWLPQTSAGDAPMMEDGMHSDQIAPVMSHHEIVVVVV